MRPKQDILDGLFSHAQKLDSQHYELAAVAMIETEVLIDIRDNLKELSQVIAADFLDHAKKI